MKNMQKIFVALALALFALSSCTKKTSNAVTLVMGSWRADDVEQMNNLLSEYKKTHPNVDIQFKPTNPSDYNATLRLQLESGTGPDLMYARSYATGQELFEAGFFADCTDIRGLQENFTATAREPWMTKDGKMFAVPFAAVSHAVYYNKDIFEKEQLSVPENWEDFLALCQMLKLKGYTPLANGVGEEWDILECFFLGGIVPDFIGGAEERVQYERGEKKLNDENFVEAYQAMKDVAHYLPEGFQSVTYNDSQALFSAQKAAMFMDGSWTAGVYKDVPFKWGVFALPAPKERKTGICFHPDMALTMNAKTAHPEECREFLSWLCTKEGATAASKNLPVGYFPMINFRIALDDVHANEFLKLNEGRSLDARFVWPALMYLYAPMNQAVIKVMTTDMTAQEAANFTAAQKK